MIHCSARVQKKKKKEKIQGPNWVKSWAGAF